MRKLSFVLAVVLCATCVMDWTANACTIGVASGVVTADGRPLLWKSRQWTDATGNHVVRRSSADTGYPYDFVGIRGYVGEDEIRMGVNEHGLAVGNALIGGSRNSWFMEYALGNFVLVSQVEDYLWDQMEMEPPGLPARSNFEFIDATGEAVMFETVPTATNPADRLYVYDTLNTARLTQGMYGWVVRDNTFHYNHSGLDDDLPGSRYESAKLNTLGLVGFDHLLPVTATQGNNGWFGYELLRYGPGREHATISTTDVCSGMTVAGVRNGEDSDLTTMWALLGQTNYGMAVPVWIACNYIPAPINNDHLADLANALEVSGLGEEFIQARTFRVEHHFFMEVAELMEHWRHDVPHAIVQMPRVEDLMVANAHSLMHRLLMLAPADTDESPIAKVKITRLPDITPVERPFGYPGDYELNSRAFDPDGTIVNCYWDFGDGSPEEKGLVVKHSYKKAGWYLISCTALDDGDITFTDFIYLHIIDPTAITPGSTSASE